MRCPTHPEIWLYENMMETKGFCPECQQWYDLKTQKKVEANQKGIQNETDGFSINGFTIKLPDLNFTEYLQRKQKYPKITKLIFAEQEHIKAAKGILHHKTPNLSELILVDHWIHHLKLMQNYFSGFGNIETQNLELNKLAYQTRDLLKKYRKKRFEN